jgi:hypothetical protein
MTALHTVLPGSFTGAGLTLPSLTGPNSGLLALWDPDTLAGADGSSITGNLVPSAGSLVAEFTLAAPNAASRPVLRTGLNGHKYIDFSTDAARQLRTGLLGSPLAGPFTLQFVANVGSLPAATTGYLAYLRGAVGPLLLRASDNRYRTRMTNAAAPNAVIDSAAISAGWAVITAVYDGTSSRIQVNERSVSGTTDAGSMDGLCISGNTGTTAGFLGQVAYAKAYNRALTPAEATTFRTEMQARFGI